MGNLFSDDKNNYVHTTDKFISSMCDINGSLLYREVKKADYITGGSALEVAVLLLLLPYLAMKAYFSP